MCIYKNNYVHVGMTIIFLHVDMIEPLKNHGMARIMRFNQLEK